MRSCPHRGKGDELRDAVFACLVFFLQRSGGEGEGKLREIVKISIYGNAFVFE